MTTQLPAPHPERTNPMAHHLDQPTPVRATPDTSKLASQYDALISKASKAHDAGDRELERSYTAKADQIRKAADPTAPLLSADGGISVRQQLIDLASFYSTQAQQVNASNRSQALAYTSTAAQITARAAALTNGS